MKKNNIIIVDDNIDFCEALQFIFEMHAEFHVKVYHDAMHFLNEYDNTLSGFLLMDLLMPGLDGISLLEELKIRHNKMYIMVTSGHADMAMAHKVKELGAQDFWPKPFNTKLLLDKIRSIKYT